MSRVRSRLDERTNEPTSYKNTQAHTESSTIDKDIQEIRNSLYILIKNAQSKDKEILRLKKGYDLAVFQSFLRRFFRVYQMVSEDLAVYSTYKTGKKTTRLLSHIQTSLEEAFLDCGLEAFSPKTGELYTKAFGVSENVEYVATNKPSKNMTIAKIKTQGFKMNNDYGSAVVQPSFVAVYKYNKNKG